MLFFRKFVLGFSIEKSRLLLHKPYALLFPTLKILEMFSRYSPFPILYMNTALLSFLLSVKGCQFNSLSISIRLHNIMICQ